MGKKSKRLHVTRMTQGGVRVLGGVFRLVDEKGIPLNLVLDRLKTEGLLCDWLAFWEDAKNGGWPIKRTWITLSTAVKEVFGQDFHDQWALRMRLCGLGVDK